MARNTYHSCIIILIFVISYYGRRILSNYYSISFDNSLAQILYRYSWWIIPVVLTIGILYGFRNVTKEIRIDRGLKVGFIFSIVAVLPMLIGSFILGSFNTQTTILELTKDTLFAGFFEEFLFRGFLFGILFRKLNWGFIPAALLGALIFGTGHIYQGSNLPQTVGIFLVTFLGAIWFAWLFIEWKENLWVPIFLHILMNFSWIAFDISQTGALGGNSANVFRAITIAMTIIITIRFNKRRDRFRINKHNLLFNRNYQGR